MSRQISSIRLHQVREIAHTVWVLAAAVFMVVMAVGAAAFAVLMIRLNEML